MENNEHIKKIAELLTISPKQVNQVLDLTAEGNTIPFIARYRKEVTGELDEVQIKAIVDEHDRVIKLTDRKTAVLAKIEELGKLSDDLKHFKAVTTGHAILMGRRTFESIGRPLPGRDSFVVTRNPVWSAAGTTVFDDVDAALDAAVATGKQVWVFGGGEIYRAAWGRTQALEITHVHAEHAGDAASRSSVPETRGARDDETHTTGRTPADDD